MLTPLKLHASCNNRLYPQVVLVCQGVPSDKDECLDARYV